MSEWISVKDKLPDTTGNYLVYNGAVIYCSFLNSNKQWNSWSDITHWMPLPEPPTITR